MRPSMLVGMLTTTPWAESFFSTLEMRVARPPALPVPPEARMALFTYLMGFYNPVRRHSALGYRSPLVYDQSIAQNPHQDPGQPSPITVTETGNPLIGHDRRRRCQPSDWITHKLPSSDPTPSSSSAQNRGSG